MDMIDMNQRIFRFLFVHFVISYWSLKIQQNFGHCKDTQGFNLSSDDPFKGKNETDLTEGDLLGSRGIILVAAWGIGSSPVTVASSEKPARDLKAGRWNFSACLCQSCSGFSATCCNFFILFSSKSAPTVERHLSIIWPGNFLHFWMRWTVQ